MVLVDYIGIFFYMWQYFWPHTVLDIHEKCSIFKEKILPVNSEVLVHLKNFESPAGCMKPETTYLNLTTANFDNYGNVSFDPCEFTLHTVANAENNDCSKKLVCFLQHTNMCEKNGDHSTSVNVDLFQSCFQI